MNLPRLLVAIVIAWAASCLAAAGTERIEAAFLFGLGRPASAEELATWRDRAALPLAELMAGHRARLRADADERQAVRARAWRDAYGCAPSEADGTAASAADPLYVAQLRELAVGLAARPEEYRRVVARAYRTALGRAPYVEEYGYWNQYSPLPYTLLVGCVENWARRNAPGLMATAGAPTIAATSEQLIMCRLSPELAAEAERLLGRSADALAVARGCRVLVPGADGIVSVGGVALLVVGGRVPLPPE